MSLRTSFNAQKNLAHVLVVILMCVGYFNYFLIAEPVNFFLQISSLTGQILVNKFLAICNYTFEIMKLTYSFFQILYEDSLIFFKDATEKFAFAIYLLKELYLFLEEFVWKLFNTFSEVLESIFRFLGFLQHTIGTVKQEVQFMGSAIWSFFMGIPGMMIGSINAVNEFLKNTAFEIKGAVYKLQNTIIECLLKIHQCFFDIPFDSVCGLIVGVILLTILCVKFKGICYFISCAFLKLYVRGTSFGISLWSGRFLEQKNETSIDFEDDERLCIVCQNQQKEIILFPCKHLCLCSYCTNQLFKHHPVCPLCRSNITSTLKIYL